MTRRARTSRSCSTTHGQESKRYNFPNSFPSGWSLGDLDAAGTDALMETLTIEHEGFSLAGKNGL